MTKGDKVYAAYVADGEVVVEEAHVAAVGERALRIEDGGRGFHWKRIFELNKPGYSESHTAALEVLLTECEAKVLRAREALQRAEAERDLVLATVLGEQVR